MQASKIAFLLVGFMVIQNALAQSGQQVFLARDAEAKQIVAQMTLDEKIGQMMQPEHSALRDPSDIEKYFLGSLLSGGGAGPKDKSKYTLAGWTEMVEGYQRHAMNTRLHIPLLYGIDAVHGNNNIPGATVFPHNIGMGCTRDAALVEQMQRITAEEVRATGINWVFAPCITVPQDERWGRTYEGYSDEPSIVAPLAAAAVRGFQGVNLADPLSVVACAKHFIGDGGTSLGSARGNEGPRLDQGDTRVDEATLRRIHLPGYIAAVNAGVGTIMPSYSSWNGVKCSANKHLLTEILKGELGFEGFLISDYNAVDQIDPDFKKSIGISINAGMDMVMMTRKYPEFFDDLKELAGDGTVPMSRIDDAVTRILRVKLAAGLMEKNWSPLHDAAAAADFGSAAHRAVARQAVQESLVLLKNDKSVLPIAKNAPHIYVSGRGASDLGMQCGGWTLDWQGEAGRNVPGATSILSGIIGAVSSNTAITFYADGTGAKKAATGDVGIVVIGETPYAEGKGDQTDLAISPEDRAVVANMKKAGIPVVVILLSGRPMILGDLLDQADAVVAAWLPGSEGEGVADVLFGDFKPVGKLSFDWPKSVDDLPRSSASLFPVGYGLTFGN
jgi:beta-glucosidase